MQSVEELFGPARKLHVGQVLYNSKNDLYAALAQVGKKQVSAIVFETSQANRYREPVQVTSPEDISEGEAKAILGTLESWHILGEVGILNEAAKAYNTATL